MKRAFFIACLAVTSSLIAAPSEAPLRVFIRGGVKTHGPGQHDHPRFLAEWKELLNQRGARADGGMDFPTADQLKKTDVLVMYAAEGGTIKPEQRQTLDKFLKRGGGMVVIHDAVCGSDPQWFKTIVGGAWEHRHSKWFEGEISFYYVNHSHPITTNCSNFDFDDEVYWDLHLDPSAKILAASWKPDQRNTRGGRQFPHIYDVIPQMWTYEKTLEGGKPYRAFVSIPGHQHKSFSLPHYRAVLLRGIAWAGQRKNVDEFCAQEELASLRYPEGGPTAPEKAAAKLEVHPDFKISLVAAEPLINKPIAIDWDPSGQLWIAETPEYPNGRRGIREADIPVAWKDHGSLDQNRDRPAYDRISILTDSNKDGRMDKKHVFYEGLELVTGFVFYKDGVIVSQAPEILWLRDVDGDGKAEKVEKLYTGLGTYDTHAVINNLRWSFDGWIYATHGYSATDHVKNGDGSKDFGRIGSGVVRFKPDGSAFEQYSSKGGNTWGLDVAWDNEVFFTQPTSGDLLNHVVTPESTLARGKVGNTASFKPVIKGRKSNPLIKYDNLAYVQIDVVGGFTASAGCAIYDGGAWPEEWNYGYFTTEPTINIIHHEAVKKDGVTFSASKTRDEEFIGGRDPWFRPIETRIGPDGALYILDFYNQAVIHNDTRGPKHNAVNAAVRPDRDHYFGRIWRVHHKNPAKLDIPDLRKASVSKLAKALEHPNRHVRMNALRLISEQRPGRMAPVASALKSKSAAARVGALWALHHNESDLHAAALSSAMKDSDPTVRKNALLIAATRSSETQLPAALQLIDDKDPRVQLQALRLLANFDLRNEPQAVRRVVAAYPRFDDPWLRSAAVAVANKAPSQFIDAALAFEQSERLADLASGIASAVAASADKDAATRIVASLANRSDSGLTKTVLEGLANGWKSAETPAWSIELQQSLSRLLEASLPVRTAALPLIARWDRNGSMAEKVKPMISSLLAQLQDATQPDSARADVATSLISIRQLNADILPELSKILGSSASASLKQRIIQALGAVADPAIGPPLAASFPKLSPQLQEAAFSQIVKRKEWSLALIDALKDGTVSPAMLGPTAVHRLRTHSDRGVARRANSVIEELRGPEAKQKEELIARLTPLVEKGGNAEQGRQLFTQNCATCHKLNAQGSDLAPDLTGMGAHGIHELLTHILDPNRFVEPNFVAWSIETTDGETYDGIIARENRNGVTLRHASGEMEIKRENIKSQRNTGRSLMPEGFEALGDEPLRDLITYLGGSDSKFRIIDLKPAFTASTTRGLFNRAEALDETLKFTKFGLIKCGDVPFEIVSPARATTGNNVIVLKGGSGYAKTMPPKVEVPVGVSASKLHFLSGVGGWAWPFGGADNNKDLPVAKVTAHFADGATEELVFKNGVEFVDYISASHDAPGSERVRDLMERGQVRWFSKPLQRAGVIQKLTIESFDNAVAPVFVAITAETEPSHPVAAPRESAASHHTEGATVAVTFGNRAQTMAEVRALIVGGGSSHDFDRWFHRADKATLMECGPRAVDYTDNTGSILSALGSINVLYLSNNQPITDPAARKGIFDFAEAGRGLLLVHPALWYNWADWPEYNRVLIGGGSKSHDKYGEFEVTVTDSAHPMMAGVPQTFLITDELYHFRRDEQGSAMQVLATGKNLATGKTYPVVWVTQHAKARIACITLGHDGAAHDHPAYKTILKNSFTWVSNVKPN